MKRLLCTIAALCAVGGSVLAQETTTDTSEDYVLQQARDKFNASAGTQPGTTEIQTTTTTTTETTTTTTTVETQPAATQPATTFSVGSTVVTIEITKPSASEQERTGPRHPYFPFVISFVPGISFPFGTYDTTFSAAPIGALTGSVNGAQAAGVFNITDGTMHGLQGAGVFNIVGEAQRGFQGAGVFNIVGKHAQGFQGAGVFNIAGDLRGAQSAGVFNIAGNINGIQMAGLFNIAGNVSGVQMAGIVNIADEASGAMIGLVNVADELDGVAIGLVNIIGNGIHDLSVDYQLDSRMTYATYRSGTPFLYAAFTAGQPFDALTRTADGLTLGSALGHRFKLLFLTADIELGAETPVDPASLQRIYEYFATTTYDDFGQRLQSSLMESSRSFGTLRASFGFGNRKGFGPYVGIKADFAPSVSQAVPASMRSSFGTTVPYTVTLFDVPFDIWPKWFLGIKF